MELAVVAKNKGDDDKIAQGLIKLMDEDKTLPWWFDPVNRHTWVQEFKEWSREVRWTPPPESPLSVYF